ncbi:predicted coding region AF_0835 [Archaeoglobus fulgidus DSM 4304]|uniref:Uncharacterized protein AF_0835 n=1 Tax=Archaeoglobus fulgidus (strain ATCC 49558 / DSM 4304 / JCM 9628 / NBRC 100126 / VC-16) TaxID=224325 RepID=Y835_ARCFU|nr:RecName: Full=Uncharacterized protein AF_0835 [Archaeoglobus fulgidus DSM 4304]AAB90421.1 predicted coding region AF_0835 [Archaeoglobus fulgidus DSM 4304]
MEKRRAEIAAAIITAPTILAMMSTVLRALIFSSCIKNFLIFSMLKHSSYCLAILVYQKNRKAVMWGSDLFYHLRGFSSIFEQKTYIYESILSLQRKNRVRFKLPRII